MPEIAFDPKKVAFAVITSYPKWYKGKLKSIKLTDKIRGDLAIEFAQKVTEGGYYLVIADRNSPKTFIKELRDVSQAKIIRRIAKGSGRGKRLAINKASKIPGVEIIVLCEPEKVSIITACLTQIVTPILEKKADIVVVERNEKLFKATYPDYMYESEKEGNAMYNEVLYSNNILPKTVSPIDWFFGPRAFRNEKKILSLFKRIYVFKGISIIEKLYSPDNISNVNYFPIVTAFKSKLKVVQVEVPFRYPPLQKENEEIGAREIFILKRKLQKISLLTDLMHFLSYLEKRKSSSLTIAK